MGAVAQWLIHDRLSKDAFLETTELDLCRSIQIYLKGVHQDFLARFEGNTDMMESAATLAGAVVRSGKACLFWSGDSPIRSVAPAR